MRRRSFLQTLLGGAMVPLGACAPQRPVPTTARFDHGVASGDPLPDRVILWTRVSGISDGDVDVNWRIGTDRAMRTVVAEGEFRTGPERDYTVKIDARGLPAGRRLYYQFSVGDTRSPLGRTRTLPEGQVASAAFAVVSCSNHPYGFFHAYREIARRDDLDAVLHLGDYIYEYGMGEYATERAESLGRVPVPGHRLLTLADYRARHAQYKADADSQVMHGRHPLIAVWDDHELANDAWADGAENHRAGDGSWDERRDAAIQAWLEWMPVRTAHGQGSTRIFRDYRFGDLLTLIMLDTRLFGRDRQPDAGPDITPTSVAAALDDPSRRLLGADQERWLADALEAAADTVWQVVAQQVMVSPTVSPDLEPLLDLEREALVPREDLERFIEQSKGKPPMLLDTWNGYPRARQDFLATLERHAANPVVLSGDLHTSLAGNLVPDDAEAPVAVELMTPSVTSPGFAEYLPEREPDAVRDATLEYNPTLAYMETRRRGWMRVQLTHRDCTAEWHLLDSVHERTYSSSIDGRYVVHAGEIANGLLPVD